MVSVMRNLWAFDWKCFKCGWKHYQGARPEVCPELWREKKDKKKK